MDIALIAAVAATRRRRRNRGLFRWRIGSPVPATSPSTVRTYIDAAGIVRTALSGVARDADYSTGQRGLLVEGERTNVLLASCDFSAGQSAWTGAADFTISAAPSIIAGQGAYLHVNLGTIGSRSRTQAAGVFSGTPETLSVILGKGSAGTSVIGVFDSTTGAFVAQCILAWATGTVVDANGPNPARSYRAIALPADRYLVSAMYTGTIGHTRTVFIYPTATSQNTNSAILHYAGLETGAFGTSPIITSGAAQTRAADAVTAVGVLPTGIHATRYELFYDLATSAVIERVVDVPSTSGNAAWTNDRAWYAMAYDAGVKTLAEMQAIA